MSVAKKGTNACKLLLKQNKEKLVSYSIVNLNFDLIENTIDLYFTVPIRSYELLLTPRYMRIWLSQIL